VSAISAGPVVQETAGPEADRRAAPPRLVVLGSWRRQILLLAGFAAMVAFFSVEQSQTFPTVDNAKTILEGLVVLGFIAVAATVVLVLGEFDLAIPSAAALAAAVIAVLTTQTSLSGSVVVAAAVGIGTATLVGATSGVAVAYGNAPSFVVTLAVSSVAGGAELFAQERIDSGTQINRFLLPEGIRKITDTELLGVRAQVFLLLAAALVVSILLSRTVFGRQAHAVGGNESAARLSGVAVRRVKITGYVVGGMLAGVAGLVLVSQQGYFTNSGPPFLLKAYAAAFFGAAAFGRNGFSVPATLLGVLFLETLSNGLRLMGEPLWVTSVVTGGLLLITVLLTRVRS
jgi:ribose transport system permease protein